MEDRFGSRLCENADVYGSTGAIGGTAKPVLCADGFHQSANAQNAHHPFHVVGQDVQRHFGADVLEYRFRGKPPVVPGLCRPPIPG
jgi:hypothetical protein